MDMEEPTGAATTAQGDLADVVARANIAMAPSSATHHHRSPPAAAPAAAHMSRRYPAAAGGGHHILVAACEEEPRPMSGDAAVMFDPYLLSTSGAYGHQHQLAAVQISQHAAYCGREGGGGDDAVNGEDAMMRMISPPTTPAVHRHHHHHHHHQMIKRKSEVRKVVCIPVPPATSGRAAGGGGGGEVVPSDLWAWRKYGQKPIKGSPYPRGYYRCSSSKGCLARKQVERSRSDPNMLVITYTAEHNHPWPMQRNVLTGYARAHHESHAAAAVGSSSASKKHKTTNNNDVATSSSNNHFPQGGYSVYYPEQDVIGGGDQPAAAASGDDGAVVGIGEGSNGVVQPDEVFAELEELLQPDNSMVNASIVCSKGVSYEWNKF